MAKELADTKPIRDDVAGDLLEIINDSKKGVAVMANNDIHHNLLMQKLTSYIVRRDHKVWNHAYQIGFNKGKENK